MWPASSIKYIRHAVVHGSAVLNGKSCPLSVLSVCISSFSFVWLIYISDAQISEVGLSLSISLLLYCANLIKTFIDICIALAVASCNDELRLLVEEVVCELPVDDGAVHADELPLLPRARVVVPAVVDELHAVFVAVPVVGLALVPVGEGEGAHLMEE